LTFAKASKNPNNKENQVGFYLTFHNIQNLSR